MASQDNRSPTRVFAASASQPGLRLDFAQIQSILPALIDSLTDAVLVVDRNQRVVAANRRYVEAFGTARAKIQGSVCHDALHCPQAGEPIQSCAACRAMDEGQPIQVVRTVSDENHSARRWEATFTPILDSAGAVTHVVEVWRDITERSQLESQVSHNERLVSLGILAAGVGHEINNPLASMLAGVESLSRMLGRGEFGIEARGEFRELLGLIEKEINRCRSSVDKLMLLAQPISSAPSDVNLNRVVSDTLSLLRFQTRRQNIEVVERLDPALPTIWARDSGIRGVCMNLSMNAVQAMPGGGTLIVSTRHVDHGVVLEVEDDGPGIPKALLDRIWDPFFTTKPVGKGTGLGLSITHRVVHRHGGTIRVESEPGHGARFIVELPVTGPGGIDV
jgi:PAS domain S-box-containing protein